LLSPSAAQVFRFLGASGNMQLTFTANDGEMVQQLDVDASMPMAELLGLLGAMFGIDGADIEMFHNGRNIGQLGSLQAASAAANDMVQIVSKRAVQAMQQQQQAAAQQQAGGGQTRSFAQGPGDNAQAIQIRDEILGDPARLNELLSNPRVDPDFVQALTSPDPADFVAYMQKQEAEKRQREHEKQMNIARLNADPFDVEAQTKMCAPARPCPCPGPRSAALTAPPPPPPPPTSSLTAPPPAARSEEIMRDENVNKMYDDAMEHNPELFARVVMLYIPVEVRCCSCEPKNESGTALE